MRKFPLSLAIDEQAGVVVDDQNNASEDGHAMRLGSFVEALLEETEVPKHRKREKARSSKPDPFFHAKRLAERSLQLLDITCRASTRG